jgi:hypothetical protein
MAFWNNRTTKEWRILKMDKRRNVKYRVNGELPEIGKIAKRKIVTKIKECTCVSMTHINNGYKRSNEKWDTKFC